MTESELVVELCDALVAARSELLYATCHSCKVNLRDCTCNAGYWWRHAGKLLKKGEAHGWKPTIK
jgi:hypothetical protein